MNRGNLAEDPKAGLSSSSRYSRNGGEKNSLLYVDSSSVRKERKAKQRRAGNQGSAIKGNHNFRKKRSVGRGSIDSHMDRLEVGSDGRLFRVKESPESSTSGQNTISGKFAETSSVSVENKGIPFTATEENPAVSDMLRAKSGAKDEASSSFETESVTGEKSAAEAKSGAEEKSAAEAKSGTKEKSATEAASGAKEEDTSELQSENDSSSRRTKPDRNYLTMANPLLIRQEPEKKTRIRRPAAEKSLQASEQTAGLPIRVEESAGAQTVQARPFFRRFRVPIIVSIAVLAAVGYGYVAWHYTNRFYPGTEFFGIPAAEKSVYDVKAAVKAKVDSYSLRLEARKPHADTSSSEVSAFAGDNVICADDVGMVYRDNGEIDNAMKQQKSYIWPVMMLSQLLGKKESVLRTSYNRSLIPEAVGRLACMQPEHMIRPQDAKIIMTDDGARVQSEICGTTLDVEKTQQAVRNALDEGSTVIRLDDLGLYVNPKVTSGDLSLTAKAMAMNKVLGAKILLRFGNRTEVMNSEVISHFLDQEDGFYTLNEEKVRKYVTRLAQKYDTYQCSRTFYTSIGTKLTLEEGLGDYGWEMDQEETFSRILEAIREQKKTTMEPEYIHTAYCRDADDIGSTYVEISLTNQTMWFYKNGQLVVETPVVTGNPYTGHETPSGGVWSLKGRMRNQTLRGQGYASPVDYWMPFNGGVGIHDMQSRAWFGGSVYLGSGSHGCVNTPLAAVKLIYDHIEDGVPVIVYKDESEEALSLVTGPTDVQTITAQIEENFGTAEDDGNGSLVAQTNAWRYSAPAAQTTPVT